jgi:protein-S-isoprenylcysteine O-methyltransferase Ste14
MADNENMTESNKRLRKSLNKFILMSCLTPVIQAVILFVSAGRMDMPRAWVYLGTILIYFPLTTIILYILNPELVKHRAERKKGTKPWDKVLLPAYIIMQFLIQTVVIGLDVGRFQWSTLGIPFAVLGFVLFILSAIIVDWAMAANPHFEATVRIQKERGHRVVTTGPYRFVRHPGYVGTMFWAVGTPLIIGSVYGLIPGGICIVLLIIRTSLEDKTLQKELDGYTAYAKRVKYRLFPGIW